MVIQTVNVTCGYTISANCWVHARRNLADVIQAADKSGLNVIRQFVAYWELQKIAEFHTIDMKLKNLFSRECL